MNRRTFVKALCALPVVGVAASKLLAESHVPQRWKPWTAMEPKPITKEMFAAIREAMEYTYSGPVEPFSGAELQKWRRALMLEPGTREIHCTGRWAARFDETLRRSPDEHTPGSAFAARTFQGLPLRAKLSGDHEAVKFIP